MLFTNYKDRGAMINQGGILKIKKAYKNKLGTFGQNFCLGRLSYFVKKIDSYILWVLRNWSSNLQRNLKEI